MITVVQGRPGSGKSYHVTTICIAHLKAGGVVATNMVLDLQEIRRMYHRRIHSWQLISLSASTDPRKIPIGDLRGSGKRKVLVVLDEALNWFESTGTSQDPRRASWGVWLRQHDKLGQDVIFIAQEFARAAKWIRELSAVAADVRNFKNIRLWGMPLGKWLRLDHLYCVVFADVRTKVQLGFEFHVIGPDVWRCYKTSELYDFEAASSAFLSSVAPAYRLPATFAFTFPVAWFVLRVFWEALP